MSRGEMNQSSRGELKLYGGYKSRWDFKADSEEYTDQLKTCLQLSETWRKGDEGKKKGGGGNRAHRSTPS